MPDRRLGGYDVNQGPLGVGRQSERKPSQIARDLDVHRDELIETAEELKEGVKGRLARGREMLHQVPDKLRQAGGMGKRAGQRVGAFARERPITTAAIGLGAAALIGGGVMLARRRRAMAVEEAGEGGAKASARSRTPKTKH